EALRGWRRVGTDEARATFVLWIWLGGALAFFSCAPSRLEHYSIPALPAVAILAARVWQRAAAGTLHARAWRYVVGLGAVATSAGLAGAVFGERLLRETYWIAQVPSLLALALPAAAVVVVTGLGMVFAATARRPAVLVGVLAAAMLPAAAIVLRAEVDAEPLFSWRPVARALGGAASADTEIVFEAPDEYQLVGGLAYYTGRRITLLEPPGGFVPPTYLAGQMDGMFLSRAAFARRWQAGERLAFVSDPQRRREDPATLVPGPFRVVGRFGDRWVLTSVPPGVG
ncbi:MAG TPA: hypothetical protein VFD84_03850, partial [Candidatus Binatia bacterium]|nr:hypothetical protein [Candidatus Binatia bacterium]